ncbi:glycosyl hydrolase family 8 [Agrobacterium rosae]|uniref:cellulase n=1 Tax=Agrobacterium rosae TaxID=1972867 RepID=A0AAE5VPP8_9HYPH|nr:glycosyl hydrolase family 8 [Agrobacterium rosae]KAA3511541.1 endoglucanase [Agrobacterium rosae]KAA3519034.1 endoglucanase [Agrobacterium rosae]MCM2435252.1 endoglucanase [Agrobacterium rosae]MDX8331013.1 glycosyl hydrolase family 8 [Agrobacterium rosae]MQB49231.1 endoglucanase [Agrobacterium rosae]
MRRLFDLSLKLLVMLTAMLVPISAMAASITQTDWSTYKTAFLDPTGRIIDTGNNNISHSEGQGYGMWLAVLADSPADFELIWSFTRTELLVRDDGLAAWKWDPQANPHISDINNATDGDILIAYALALAAKQWSKPDYADAARSIAKTVIEKAVVVRAGRTLLLPGTVGFGEKDRPDGPVVNPSYFIFEAFPVLNELAPSPLWGALTRDGLAQISSYAFGPKKLPADWVSVKTKPRPADGFPQEFGYNSVRIPLYLARAGVGDAKFLERLRAATVIDGGNMATFDLRTGSTQDVLSDAGYRIIPALTACIIDRKPIPDDLRRFTSTLYYPSTLHLLGLSFATQAHQECL